MADLRGRRDIAKAITLVESTRPEDRAAADALLEAIAPRTGNALRIGLSGAPGAGKSTLIESLGCWLLEQGRRVAVLAVDPSSSVHGGSLLGDKTRMPRLSTDERAFVRPSPASGVLGGVAGRTREAMRVLEAAGHDVVIVETVGVGQSETAVAGMTDVFVLLQLPHTGDELQGLKKGVVEWADLVLVNKADIDDAAASRAQGELTNALQVLHRGVPVLKVSGLTGAGLPQAWAAIEAFAARQPRAERRRRQEEAWMWERVQAGLQQRFDSNPAVQSALDATLQELRAGTLAAPAAAKRLLDLLD